MAQSRKSGLPFQIGIKISPEIHSTNFAWKDTAILTDEICRQTNIRKAKNNEGKHSSTSHWCYQRKIQRYSRVSASVKAIWHQRHNTRTTKLFYYWLSPNIPKQTSINLMTARCYHELQKILSIALWIESGWKQIKSVYISFCKTL